MKNLENLKEKMVFKNYKELCDFLQEDIKNGKSKKIQIQEWERYFSILRDKQKYVVDEIYNTPIPKELFNKKSIYVSHIANIILCMLEQQQDEIIITRRNLMFYLGMFNENYLTKDMTNYEGKFISPKSEKYNVNKFFETSYKQFSVILTSALKSLHYKSLIHVTNEYMICIDYDRHLANEYEFKQIKEIEYLVLEKLQFKSVMEVYLKHKEKEYQELVSEMLFEKYGWTLVYKVLKIVPYSLNNINMEINIKKEKGELNNKVINKVKEQNKKIYDRQYQLKYNSGWGEQENMFMYSDTFVEIQNTLTDYFVKLDYEANGYCDEIIDVIDDFMEF